MNLYFLVEGKRTEMKILPKWLAHLIPNYTRVNNAYDAIDHHYFLTSGYGYPSIFDYIEGAIDEINDSNKYDYFIICIDADEVEIEERRQEILDYINEKQLSLKFCNLKIIVQNRCIETWLLGNRKIYPRHPENKTFIQYASFYNVSENDPELMGIFPKFRNHASFHEKYLKEMLQERNKNIRYTKEHPGVVTDPAYLEELINRCEDTNAHLASFKTFIDLIKKL